MGSLTKYWAEIDDHRFVAAYNDLLPGSVPQSEPQFISSEQQAGILTASFSGTTTARSGATAVVDVNSLITRDRQFGCRQWAGTYDLVRRAGVWLIAKADISPHACG